MGNGIEETMSNELGRGRFIKESDYGEIIFDKNPPILVNSIVRGMSDE
jgi:hypothetical protein